MPRASRALAVAGACGMVGVLLYLGTVRNGFVWDDHELLARAPDWVTTWRPVDRVTLLIDGALHGSDPSGFHLTNALLHGLASALVAAVALGTSRRTAAAAVAGLLFATHPVHVEAVAAVAHRKESLALVFICATLLAARAARARPWLWVVAATAFLLALGSKEVAGITTPLLVYLDPERAGRTRRWTGATAALALVSLATLPWLSSVLGGLDGARLSHLTEGRSRSYASVVRTAIAAYGWDVRMLVAPWPLYLDRDFPAPRDSIDPRFLGGAAALLFTIAVARWLDRTRRDAFFGLTWFVVTLVPVSGVVPLSHWAVAKRFLYPPSAGAGLLAGALLGPLIEGPTWCAAVSFLPWSRRHSSGSRPRRFTGTPCGPTRRRCGPTRSASTPRAFVRIAG